MDQIAARTSCAFTFCFLLSIAGALERQRTEKLLMRIDDNKLDAFTENEYDMVNQLWSICKQETKNTEAATRSSEISDMNKIDSNSILSSSPELQNSINMLPPQLKHLILDCLVKGPLSHSVSGKYDKSIKVILQQLEDFLGWYVERRVLKERQVASSLLRSNHDSPAPAPSPFSHKTFESPPAPSPASLSQVPAPSPAERLPSAPLDQFGLFSPPINNADIDARMKTPPSAPSDEEVISTRTMELVVALTALSTFMFVAILFCCYVKCFRHGSAGDFYKDDRPLLALSRSDFSVGSSPMSQVSNTFLADSHRRMDKGKGSFGTYPFSWTPSRSKLSNEVELSPAPPMQTLESLFLEGDSTSVESKKPSSTVIPVENSSSEALLPTPPPLLPPSAPPTPSTPPTPPIPSAQPTASAQPTPAAPPPPPATPAARAPPPPPLLAGGKPGPQAPPPPKGAAPPRPPPPNMNSSKASRPPLKGKLSECKTEETDESAATKAKLKPFFWDKVNANPSHSMVWDQIKSGSFQFNEEMIESLFGANSSSKPKSGQKKGSDRDDSVPHPQILDPKKSQNLSILLRALNVTIEEVRDALLEGNELSIELIQTLLKMEPTAEEEFKLRVYTGDLAHLGPAERFLKTLVDIPFAFKRLDSLLFMGILEEDVANVKTSLMTLEVACQELKNSRLFMKLLEAVLKTGNRMNDGTYRGGAQAFKLDTLLKLSDVRGTDGKTTLLHFVVKEIIRSEGRRAVRAARGNSSISSLNSDDILDEIPPETGDHLCSLGLQVVSGLGDELDNVKKAAAIDADMLTSTVSTLGTMLLKTKKILNSEMQGVEESGHFIQVLTTFSEHAEDEITNLLNEEKRIMTLVKTTTDYFHGNSAKDEGLRLFVIVRDFLCMLDKACKQVQEAPKRVAQTPRAKGQAMQIPNPRNLLFPAISNISNRSVDSSDDDESPSP